MTIIPMTDREKADRKAKRLMMSGYWQHVDHQRRAMMAPHPRGHFNRGGRFEIARLSNERDIRAYANDCARNPWGSSLNNTKRTQVLADYGLA
jgi:hypothetical protein